MYHSVDILTVFTASSTVLNDCHSFLYPAESVESSWGLYGNVLENMLPTNRPFGLFSGLVHSLKIRLRDVARVN